MMKRAKNENRDLILGDEIATEASEIEVVICTAKAAQELLTFNCSLFRFGSCFMYVICESEITMPYDLVIEINI